MIPSLLLNDVCLFYVDGKRALVPLTSSVYVDSELVGCDRVLVDIGTGYYIEQVSKTATLCVIFISCLLCSQRKALKNITKEKSNTFKNN